MPPLRDLRRVQELEPAAVVLGNEAGGLPDDVASAADARASIPMAGRAESLNVSMAAAVVLFEAMRQRRVAGSTMPGMDGAPDAPPPATREPA